MNVPSLQKVAGVRGSPCAALPRAAAGGAAEDRAQVSCDWWSVVT